MGPDSTINDLLLGWRDDALTPAEYDRLIDLLQTPEARRMLVEEFTFASVVPDAAVFAPQDGDRQLVSVSQQELESLLALRARQIESSGAAALPPELLPPGNPIFDGEDRGRWRSPAAEQPAWGSKPSVHPRGWFGIGRSPLGVAAVAAILLISAAAVWRFGFSIEDPPTVEASVVPEPPAPVAHVISLAGALEVLNPDGTSRSVVEGQEVLPGQTLRTLGMESYAVVAFEDQTRLELSVDTSLRFGNAAEIARGKRVYLTTGVLRADVAKQPPDRPMIVSTAQADIRVVGTRFSVSSAMLEATRVDMESGSVQLFRQSDGRTVEVSAGSYAVARADAETVVVQRLPRFIDTPRLTFNTKWTSALFAAPQRGGRGARLYAGTTRGVQVWDEHARLDYQLVFNNVGELGPAAFSDNGRFAALAASRGGKILLWDLTAHRTRSVIDTHLPSSKLIAVAPDGSWVAAADLKQGNLFRLYDTVGGADGIERSATQIDELRDIRAIAASPNGTRIAVAGTGDKRIGIHRIYLYDPRTGTSRDALAGHGKPVRSLAFSPDGRTLASAGDDGTLRLWDIASRSFIHQIDGHAQPLNCLAFSPDGSMIAGGGNDGRVWIWDSHSGTLGLVISAGFRPVKSITFTPDGRRIVTTGFDAPIQVFDLPVASRPSLRTASTVNP